MKYDDIKKLQKLKLGDSKLLKIKFIKDKIYKKNHYSNNISIEDIKLRLKKALYIIYLYHIHNKTILFVGGSLKILKKIQKLLKNTKHRIIPQLAWIPGVITNQKASKFFLKKINKKNDEEYESEFKLMEKLSDIKRKSDLIVILDENDNNTALNEGYLKHKPIISLNNLLNIFNVYSSYKIPGDFSFNKELLQSNFFLVLLTSIFKKAKLRKIKNYSKLNYKLSTTNKLKKQVKKYYKKKKKRRYYKSYKKF